MIRRPRRTVPATLVSLVLLGICVLVATSAIQLLLGERPLLSYAKAASALHELSWNEAPVAVGGVVLAALGLVLVLFAVLPGRPVVLPLAAAGSSLDSGATRRGLRADMRSTAAAVDGVSGAKLTLHKGRASVRVTTNRTNSDGLAEAVRTAIEQRLDEVAPARRPKVRVRVSAPRRDR
ncbi:hypothetical protein SAMN05216266_101327 [Amycolatopsis marina]|uniref:DUF6286 domain-containing protein n=1 Tax=Amycolatopsis marina TaxID=490629 RepID=A0A1I0VMF2_9PSEU|nr:DUF6286 domain-containing protein [Amycolatopsis marina]SFA77060.1 hypothetical protein SAMN05216266_101327 [Amycolatopsis marina]